MRGLGTFGWQGMVLAALVAGGAPAWAQSVGAGGPVTITGGGLPGRLVTSGTLANARAVTLSRGPITLPAGIVLVNAGSTAVTPRITVTDHVLSTNSGSAALSVGPVTLAGRVATPAPVAAVSPVIAVTGRTASAARTQGGVAAPALVAAPVIRGPVTVRDGGLVSLVGPSAAGNGTVAASVEQVSIAGVPALTVDLAGDGFLRLQVERPVVDAQGRVLTAGSATVALSAGTARDVVSGVTNAGGRVSAATVAREGGVIVFGGAPLR